MADTLDKFRRMMEEAGQPARAALDFERMYGVWASGFGGFEDWDAIERPGEGDLVGRDELVAGGLSEAAPLDSLGWIVLNGGIGTSMRMERAKSLIKVMNGKSFLGLIAGFALKYRASAGVGLPVVFMDSYATSADTLKALEGSGLAVPGLPLDFLQHKFPRIRAESGGPFKDFGDPEAWAPPGHGDLFLALELSGMLKALLERGIRRVFVSNADNLGASPDPAILGYMAREGIEFILEVTPRTGADSKGGALVKSGRGLKLLEIAQVPPERVGDFQNPLLFPAFNTNNAWIDLVALKSALDADAIRLPVIINRKTVAGEEVVQLEHAFGAAIATFGRAAGVVVGRERFAPVKTTDDLLARRSDCFVEGEASPLVPSPKRDPRLGVLEVSLDRRFYSSEGELDLRIPSAPSLVNASALTVVGDVRFGAGVKISGRVRIENPDEAPMIVPDGAEISGP